MTTPPQRGLQLAVWLIAVLAAVSGAIDVVTLVYAEVFVANQTGNLVVVAAATLSSPDRVVLAITALVCFTLGVVAGAGGRRVLRRRMSPTGVREALLGIEVVAVAAAAVIVAVRPSDGGLSLLAPISMLAAAQGIQAVLLTRLVGRGVRTVAVTGPLTDLLVGGVEAWGVPRAPGGERRRLLLLAAATPVGYAAGAALGAVTVKIGLHAGLVAAVLLALVAALLARGVEGLGLDVE